MKSELRAAPHGLLPGQTVVEVWHDGRFIATVYGTDGPGLRVFTKHPLTVVRVDPLAIEIRIEPAGPAEPGT